MVQQKLSFQVIAPAENGVDACATMRFPGETARVWNGVLKNGECEVSGIYILKLFEKGSTVLRNMILT